MRCLFANGRCSQCGAAMAVKDRRECSAVPTQRAWKPRSKVPHAKCPHFLGATVPAETVLVYGCRTCRGAKGSEATVCGCALHGRCITFRGGELRDATVTRCRDCPDNPANYQQIEQGD